MQKSLEEISNLKRDWERDPSWDIEDTEGFEEYRDQLLEYREEKERSWEFQHRQRLINEYPTSPAFPTDSRSKVGLTKREYFAALAMQGLLANPHCSDATNSDLCSDAVDAADKLIEKLNK